VAEVVATHVYVQGIRTLMREAGPADSPEAVVFLHGNPGSSEDFAELMPHIGDFARALAPDMPGYGQSERPVAFEYTVEGFARHVDAVMRHFGVKRAHLVLHDFGGPWGLAWAAAHPDRVASLVLINVGVLPGYRYHKFARLWRTPFLGELSAFATTRAIFKLALNRDNPKPLPEAILDRMFDQWDRPTRRAVLSLYRATPPSAVSSVRQGEALLPHALPALVIWGRGDRYVPVRYADVQKRFFDASVHVIDDAGHWPMIDEPDRTCALVLPFLRGRVGAASARVSVQVFGQPVSSE
jgi:pimeloyl-ACP methyl ester carboxylesterase